MNLSNGQNGSVMVLPLEVAPILVRTGSGSKMLKVVGLNMKGYREVEKEIK